MNSGRWVTLGQEIRFLIGEVHSRFVSSQVGRGIRVEYGVRYLPGSGLSIGSHVEILRDTTLDARGSISPAIQIGDRCRVKENVWLAAYGGYIWLGDDVLVGRNAVLHGHGGIELGNWSMLGPNVVIASANHLCRRSSVPFQNQGFEAERTIVGANCWIGANVTITPGVEIGNGCVVGAGAVVTHDIPSGSIAVGAPARVSGTVPDTQSGGHLVVGGDPQLEMSHPVSDMSRLRRIVNVLTR